MPDTQPTDAIDRIPLTHSVRYAVRGLPEVPNQYGPGTLAPSEITLTYRTSPDSQLGRIHAYVAGRLWVDGKEIPLLPGGLYGQHYDDGVGDWPEWLAEEARLHDPDAVPVSSPPPDQTALEERVARRLAGAWISEEDWQRYPESFRAEYLAYARDVLAFVPLPPPADRAAVLSEAADFAEETAEKLRAHHEFERSTGALDVMTELRLLAAAEQAHPPIHAWRVETRDPVADQWAPGSHFAHRPNALERLDTANRTAPLWNDGTPVERRIVRETTTYTVEEQPTADTAPESGRV